MEDVLFEWLLNYSNSYKKLISLRDDIEKFVAKENDSEIPKFIHNRSYELSYQEPLYPLLSEIQKFKRDNPSCVRGLFKKLEDDTKLFRNTPYHAYYNMIETGRDATLFSVRNSKDFSYVIDLEKLLEEYMNSIRKTCKDIVVLFEKVKNIETSKYTGVELFNLVKNEWTNLNL